MNFQTPSHIQLVPIGLILTTIGGTLFIARNIGLGNTSQLIWYGLIAALGIVAMIFAGDWRRGLYFFIVWLLFEDLIRKYMGNNMVIFLAKDALVAVAYVVFFIHWRQGKVHFFRPPFLVPMLLVVWIGIAQVFNPLSPSIFYGIVGFKLYFYYIPLMFLAYELIRSEKSLQIFLVFNLFLASIIALAGIAQSIIGPEFLNPQNLAAELEALNLLFRKAPEHDVFLYRTPGVFLSDGRFGWYMVLMFIVSFGTLMYLTFAGKGWMLMLLPALALGLCTTAVIMGGSRGSFMQVIISGVVLVCTMAWSAFQNRRFRGAIRQSSITGFSLISIGLAVMLLLFPEEFNARWQFYVQTLIPGTEHSEIEYRIWAFPVSQFMANVSAPFAFIGYGIGNASQALVYVPRIFGVPLPDTPRAGESGFGTIAAELGYLGLFLWVIFTLAILYTGWRVVYQLRQTHFFPIGFAILWYAVITLILQVFSSIMGYQNFVSNAYLWLLLGVLFKLPALAFVDERENSERSVFA